MRAVALFGDLGKRAEPVLKTAAAPAIPGPDDCVGSDGAIDFLAPVSYTHLDVYNRQPSGRRPLQLSMGEARTSPLARTAWSVSRCLR